MKNFKEISYLKINYLKKGYMKNKMKIFIFK